MEEPEAEAESPSTIKIQRCLTSLQSKHWEETVPAPMDQPARFIYKGPEEQPENSLWTMAGEAGRKRMAPPSSPSRPII